MLMWAQTVKTWRAQEKALDEMKNMKDFNHTHNGKRTETDDKQQPREQFKKPKIYNCKYYCAAHGQRQCLTFGKAISGVCGKQSHFKVVCKSSEYDCKGNQSPNSPNTCTRCTKRRKSPCQTEKRATRVLTQ